MHDCRIMGLLLAVTVSPGCNFQDKSQIRIHFLVTKSSCETEATIYIHVALKCLMCYYFSEYYSTCVVITVY